MLGSKGYKLSHLEGTYPIGSHPTATSLPITLTNQLYSKCLLLLVQAAKVMVLGLSTFLLVERVSATPVQGSSSPLLWGLLLDGITVNTRTQEALGARGQLPRGHIEVTLRFLKQFVHTLPRGYMLDSFEMYPPL